MDNNMNQQPQEPKAVLNQPSISMFLNETALGLIKALAVAMIVEAAFIASGLRTVSFLSVYILSTLLCFLLWRNRIQTHNSIVMQVLAAFELYSKRDKNQ